MAHVSRPDGSIVDVPMQWSGERSGEYSATVPTAGAGLVRSAHRGHARRQDDRDRRSTHLRAAPGRRRVLRRHDARRHAAAHRRRDRRQVLHAARRIQGLAEDLRYTGRGVTTVEERDLWHLPIMFVLLIGLLCAEWGYRRAVGLS